MKAGTITLVCILLLSMALNIFLYADVKTYKAENGAYKQQMAQLEEDSKEDAVRYQTAYQRAYDRMTKAQDNVQAILKSKVPANCDAAMQWLIKRSQKL